MPTIKVYLLQMPHTVSADSNQDISWQRQTWQATHHAVCVSVCIKPWQ